MDGTAGGPPLARKLRLREPARLADTVIHQLNPGATTLCPIIRRRKQIYPNPKPFSEFPLRFLSPFPHYGRKKKKPLTPTRFSQRVREVVPLPSLYFEIVRA
ncbi:hypothetical protein JTE90_008143 [Oedothorax gibbosus]|uniref:Uncharacterized protein n=1 Tax=Oedothorax gibbosus TaxID=931172 RepID=A0AAV6TCH7_9ARAC|nr:hypothetical protein JTE90_008143 [Oedothorax gibbosus]